MRPEEALNHRFLASDASMVRRRQGIQYSCNRLRRTAERRFRQQNQIARNGIDHSPVPADQRTTLQVPNGGANNIGSSINGSGPNRQKSPVENGKLKPPAAKPDSSSTLAEIAKNRRLAALI